jgi:Peptidase family M1 domain
MNHLIRNPFTCLARSQFRLDRVALAFLACVAMAFNAAAEAPDPRDIFAPLTFPDPAGPTRSVSGIPGPAYWQNRADYTIAARIDPAMHVLTGHETITYVNNSPDALDILWLQMDQNIYRADARAAVSRRCCHYTDGNRLDKIEVETDGQSVVPAFIVSDTRLRISLRDTLAPHGGTVRVRIDYHYTIPGSWGGRTAVTPSSKGDIFEIAQWFPRMAVYDDLRGWDTLPYLGSEFYCEYGDIDYRVTVPWDYIVAGSGDLLNASEVLTGTQRERLAQAATSDATVMIRTPLEVGDPTGRPTHDGEQTWHFLMRNTRDAAFAASPAFVWDAARINLPNDHHALAMSVYPPEAGGPDHWERSTEYVKAGIEEFSRRWFPYPWPVMVNVGGHGADMEYPGILFDGMEDAGKKLYWLTTHEVGHSWFPMIVGSNERRDAWMDEGFNTFIDVYASDAFNHGEYAPKRDPEYAEGGGDPVDEILPILADDAAPAILTAADQIDEKYRHAISYFKAALGLVLLREQILGPDRFDDAFRTYIAAWAYKHPSPSDFFRLMDSRAGEDLSWWWRGWYLRSARLDLAVTRAVPVAGEPPRLHLELVNRGRLVMPALLELRMSAGDAQRITIPAEAWRQSNTLSIDVPVSGDVKEVVLDPDHQLPLSDRMAHSVEVR